MSPPTKADILKALSSVEDKDRGGNVVALEMVQGITIREGHVLFSLEVDPARGPAGAKMHPQHQLS